MKHIRSGPLNTQNSCLNMKPVSSRLIHRMPPIEENMKTLLLQYIGKLNPEDDVDFYDYVGDRFAATLYYQEIKDKLRVKLVTRLQAFVRGFLVRRDAVTAHLKTIVAARV